VDGPTEAQVPLVLLGRSGVSLAVLYILLGKLLFQLDYRSVDPTTAFRMST